MILEPPGLGHPFPSCLLTQYDYPQCGHLCSPGPRTHYSSPPPLPINVGLEYTWVLQNSAMFLFQSLFWNIFCKRAKVSWRWHSFNVLNNMPWWRSKDVWGRAWWNSNKINDQRGSHMAIDVMIIASFNKHSLEWCRPHTGPLLVLQPLLFWA